jgi:hypothetical protein
MAKKKKKPRLKKDEYQCQGCKMIWKWGTSHPCLPRPRIRANG